MKTLAALILFFVTSWASAMPCPSGSLTASAGTISAGGAVQLNWTSQNATVVNISPGYEGLQASGALRVVPDKTQEYKLILLNKDCPVAKIYKITVTVN